MFNVKSISETNQILQANFQDYPLRKRMIKVEDALNYVSTSELIATEDIPHFNRSIVDGYAVDFNSVKLASSSTPTILKLVGEVVMGKAAQVKVTEETTVYVPTGGHLPDGANSVVMIENTDQLNDEIIINKKVTMWENTLLKGSDIKKGNKVLKQNTLITPLVIGALKALGIEEIEVYEKLKCVVISTGDEIVKNKKTLEIGEIRDINTYTISNHLKNKKLEVINEEIINDDFNLYKAAIIKGFETADIVITSGGSSVGEKDYTFAILKSLGATVLVHGINIKPGKPTIIAKYKNKLFFGLPGQPTSAFFVLNTFIDPIIKVIYHLENTLPTPYFDATLALNVHSVTGRRMYQLVKVTYNEENILIATPLFAKSGMINALKEASGYIIIEDTIEGKTAGEHVKVYRLGD